MKIINNVAIFFGGNSSERNISIESGYSIFRILLKKKIKVFPVDLKYFSLNDFLKKKIDKVFIALHGKIGENGNIQGFLDFLNISYTGSGVFTSSLCINKYNTKKFLSIYNINVLPDFLLKKNIIIKNNFFRLYKKILFKFNVPFILKPNDHGSSIGLNLINNFIDFKNYFNKNINFFNDFIVEKYIFGDEYTVAILDGKILCPINIKFNNKIFDYYTKYKNINNFSYSNNIKINIKNKLIDISKNIWKILNCKGCVRIDYIIDKFNNIWFLELNTIPGMTNTSLVPICAKFSNISYSKLILKILYC